MSGFSRIVEMLTVHEALKSHDQFSSIAKVHRTSQNGGTCFENYTFACAFNYNKGFW